MSRQLDYSNEVIPTTLLTSHEPNHTVSQHSRKNILLSCHNSVWAHLIVSIRTTHDIIFSNIKTSRFSLKVAASPLGLRWLVSPHNESWQPTVELVSVNNTQSCLARPSGGASHTWGVGVGGISSGCACQALPFQPPTSHLLPAFSLRLTRGTNRAAWSVCSSDPTGLFKKRKNINKKITGWRLAQCDYSIFHQNQNFSRDKYRKIDFYLTCFRSHAYKAPVLLPSGEDAALTPLCQHVSIC